MLETREEMAVRPQAETEAMARKRWSIRLYYTYVDEYHVIAPTLAEAYALTEHPRDHPTLVTQVRDNAYVDFDGACGNEIDDGGTYLSDVEEL